MTIGIITKALLVGFLGALVLLSVLFCENQRQEAEQRFAFGIQQIDSNFPDYCQARIHFENAGVIVKRWSFFPANLIVKRKPDYPFYMAVAAAVSSKRVSVQPCPVSGFPSTLYAQHDLVSVTFKSFKEANEWAQQWYAETGQDVIPILFTELCQQRKEMFGEFVEVLNINAESDCAPSPDTPISRETRTGTKVVPAVTPTVVAPVGNTAQPTSTPTARMWTPTPHILNEPVPTPSPLQPPKATLLPAPSIAVIRGQISFSECRRTVIHWGWIRPLVGRERFSLRVVREHPTPQYETRAGGDYFEPENSQPREFRITDVGIQGSFWVFGYVSADGEPISYESDRIFIVCGEG